MRYERGTRCRGPQLTRLEFNAPWSIQGRGGGVTTQHRKGALSGIGGIWEFIPVFVTVTLRP